MKTLKERVKNLEKSEDLTSQITNYNSAITNKIIEFKRQGHIYFLSATIASNTNWTADAVLFKIPTMYIPSNGVNAVVRGAANAGGKVLSIAANDGKVALRGDTSSTSWINFCATWIK